MSTAPADDQEKSHIYRQVPPWRIAPPLTQCGREPSSVASVISVDDAAARWKKEGPMRAAYTLCMTCVDRTRSYSRRGWAAWQANPMEVLVRDSHGPHEELAQQELHALAALVAAHPEEFAALMSKPNEIAAARAKKRQPRRVSGGGRPIGPA